MASIEEMKEQIEEANEKARLDRQAADKLVREKSAKIYEDRVKAELAKLTGTAAPAPAQASEPPQAPPPAPVQPASPIRPATNDSKEG